MTFYVGTKFKLHNKIFTITGHRQLRKKYYYHVVDEFGRNFSINREELIQGINDGDVQLI